MKQLICFSILTAMVLTVTANATHLNAVEGGELIYKSRFMIDDKGDKLLTRLPLENIAGSKSPVVLKARDGIASRH